MRRILLARALLALAARGAQLAVGDAAGPYEPTAEAARALARRPAGG